MKKKKRRSKAQIELDNIEYVLRKNEKAIKTALTRYDNLTKAREEWGLPPSFAMQKVNLEGGRFDFEGKNYYEVLDLGKNGKIILKSWIRLKSFTV